MLDFFSNKAFKTSPSSAVRWTECLASPGFILDLLGWEEEVPDYTQTGLDEHDIAAKAITSNKPLSEIPEEVRPYVEYVRELPGAQFSVETRFPVPYRKGSICLIDYSKIDGGDLHVVDLKTGHKFVDVVENLQLSIYGEAVRRVLSGIHKLDSVVLHIVSTRQPVNKRFQHIEYSLDDITEIMHPVYEAAQTVRRTPWQDLPFAPSEDACRYCPLKGSCPARGEATMELAAKAKTLMEPRLISNAMIGRILSRKKEIKKVLEDVSKEAFRRANTADAAAFLDESGLKWVQGRPGNRRWVEGFDPTLVLGNDALGDTPRLSPTQVEDRLGEEAYAKVSDSVERRPGEPVLVPTSDKRPALEAPTSTDVKFTDISTETTFSDVIEPDEIIHP